MGSHLSSHQKVLIDGEKIRIDKIKRLIPELRMDNKLKDEKLRKSTKKIIDLESELYSNAERINQMMLEIDKLKSVLEQKSTAIKEAKITSIKESSAIDERKLGISGEVIDRDTDDDKESLLSQKVKKTSSDKQIIKDAILNNNFLKHIDLFQIKEIVEYMKEIRFLKGKYVTEEGTPGDKLFVISDGELVVYKKNREIRRLVAGDSFGELALLYNCLRTASIKALSDTVLWQLDRNVFQQIMRKTGMQRQKENMDALLTVPLLTNIPKKNLVKLAGVIEREFYTPGSYIVREGELGDTFFILRKGKVLVTQKSSNNETNEIRTLEAGSYFGEIALISEEKRTASVIALQPGVECFIIDRISFTQLIGPLEEFEKTEYVDKKKSQKFMLAFRTTASIRSESMTELYRMKKSYVQENPLFKDLTLNTLEVIAILGQGGFGRVKLVYPFYTKKNVKEKKRDDDKAAVTYALKCINKSYVVESKQQEHVFSEKNIMMRCNCEYIVKCFKTFKDERYVYLLLESCLGGEVWTILRDRNTFDFLTTRFYVACVLEALEYLHNKKIIYRDLKPENMMLDSQGYCKLVDFGFAKNIEIGKMTWTFCGTPEYVAPEIILNRGHDEAVDYWAIGILIFELMTGMPPFINTDPMKTYNQILKGVEYLYFPPNITKHGVSIIKKLCKENPSERLGYQKSGFMGIRKHKFFQAFDWSGLRSRKLTPPIIPKIANSTDISNFDDFQNDEFTPPIEVSGWDAEF